jgi:hypothetical protein
MNMKTGRTLQALAGELDRQAREKKDYLADTQALRLEPHDGHDVVLRGVNGGMPLRPLAHGQLAAATGIPKAYYDRLLQDAPDLLATNVNRWLANKPERRLLRTLDGAVRAYLTDSYRPLDNFDLASAVLPRLTDLRATVVSGEVTENRFYLKAVTDKIAGEVKKGDLIQAGVVVSNSEVGDGALRIEVLDYRLACTNGMVSETAIRKAHLGRGRRDADVLDNAVEFMRDETRMLEDKAFFSKVQDAMTAMFDQARFDKRLDRYRAAAGMEIKKDPAKVVEATAKTFGLTEAEGGNVLAHLIRGGDLSAWGLANAITRSAEDCPEYDRASDLEKFGGKVIELEPSQWKVLAV